MVEPGDHVLHEWKVDRWVLLCRVSKRMGRFVIRLKAIKYKEDSFCYLFF